MQKENRGRRDDYLPERKQYEKLCRGEGIRMVSRLKLNTLLRVDSEDSCHFLPSSCQTPRRQSRLFCRYYDNDRHPRFVIGPLKQEDEWDSPHIVRYHDIVSDRDMEKVKELAKPRVRRCLPIYTARLFAPT